MKDDGTHSRPITWDPSCPLAAVEYIFQHQLEEDEPKRCYPAYIAKSTAGEARLGVKSIAKPSQAAVDFMEAQGLPRFDTNSGRKGLARWCKHLNVPYELSVHIHGDLECVWRHSYQDRLDVSHYRADNINPPPLKEKISDFFLGALNIFQKSPNLQKGFLIFSKIVGSKILV